MKLSSQSAARGGARKLHEFGASCTIWRNSRKSKQKSGTFWSNDLQRPKNPELFDLITLNDLQELWLVEGDVIFLWRDWTPINIKGRGSANAQFVKSSSEWSKVWLVEGDVIFLWRDWTPINIKGRGRTNAQFVSTAENINKKWTLPWGVPYSWSGLFRLVPRMLVNSLLLWASLTRWCVG
jgi:hypothetical protein